MSDLIKLAANLEDMEEYSPLPAGPYRAEIREVEVRFSEKQPNGYLYMVLRVDPSDFPADYDSANAPEGVKVVYARVQLPDPNNRRTVKPFKDFVKALGVQQTGAEFNISEWLGKEVQVVLTVQDYQGVPTNNVDSVRAVPSV